MAEPIKVECPDCKCILIIDRRDGKVLEHRPPLVEESSGDRFKDAFSKASHRKDLAAEKAKTFKEAQAGKSKKLDSLFKDSLKRAQEEGPVEKPKKDIDL